MWKTNYANIPHPFFSVFVNSILMCAKCNAVHQLAITLNVLFDLLILDQDLQDLTTDFVLKVPPLVADILNLVMNVLQ